MILLIKKGNVGRYSHIAIIRGINYERSLYQLHVGITRPEIHRTS